MTPNRLQQPKTILLPYMSDHCYVVQAALETHGLPTEVLPPPDNETLEIGLGFCRGRECLPCFITTGDIIRRACRPDFDPARAQLLMPTATGPCRFGQYSALQRDLLARNGLGDLEIISPSAGNSYQGFGDHPTRMRKLAWQGTVAVDLLQKLVHEYRPYELTRGQTDQIYQQCLQTVLEAVREGGGKALIGAMRWAASQFETLPVDRSEPRPVIGLVGEIYLRFNAFGNQEVIRQVEATGGEVVVATMMEWIYFTNLNYKKTSRSLGNYLDFLTTFIVDAYQRGRERRLVKPVEHLLKFPHESPIEALIEHIQPYYEPYLGTEAVLSMGKAIDFARLGLSGILNVMPFSCMPGIITAGMAPRLRADLNNIPWLDVIYDAQGGTNLNTRLEAFMYQTKQYQRQMGGRHSSPRDD